MAPVRAGHMRPELPSGPGIYEVTSVDELQSVYPAWRALWERARFATPFQSPEWLLCWWRVFGGNGLWTLLLRDREGVCGIAPFYLHTDERTGVRQITLLGNGISDTLDIVVDPRIGRTGADAVFAYLVQHSNRWDLCDFRDLSENSELLNAALPAQLRDDITDEDPCLVLRLGDSSRSAAGHPVLARSSVRKARRRAEKLGAIAFETAHGDAVHTLLDDLTRLHTARWSVQGEPGVLNDPSVQRFHHGIIDEFEKNGWLRLHALRVDRVVVAVVYGFVVKGRAYQYIGGFDPAYVEISPGTLLLDYVIRDAISSGAGEFDFLRGREPYKYSWGASARPQFRRRLRHT